MTREDIIRIAEQKRTIVCVVFKHYEDYRKVFGDSSMYFDKNVTEWYIIAKKYVDEFIIGHCRNINCKSCKYLSNCHNPTTYYIEYDNLNRERKLKRILK